MTGNAVIFGSRPADMGADRVLTDGAGRLQVSVSYGGTGQPILLGNSTDGVAGSATANKQGTIAYGYVFNGTTWDRQRGDTTGSYSVNVPSSAAASGIVPAVAQAAFSLVVKASPGNFFGGYILAGATAGYLIAYNAVAAPAAGAALTPALVLGVVAVAANSPAALGDYLIPDRFGVGIVLLFSTSLTTFTQPANAAQFLRGKGA